MFDATSQSEARPDARIGTLADGRAEIGFSKDGDTTRLVHLYNRDPLRFLFPTPAGGDCMQAGLVTTSGGLVGGDRLSIDVRTQSGAIVSISPSAAEKVYRSTGADTEMDVALHADGASWLEWLPQETILFNESRLKRVTQIEANGDARIFAGEMLVFGRIGRGERLTRGLVRECWEVRRDGRLMWGDNLHMDGDIASTIAHPAGFGGATAAATAIYAGPDGATRLADTRASLEEVDGVRMAASAVNGVVVTRFLSGDSRALRIAFGKFWAAFRNRAANLPASLPRLWHV